MIFPASARGAETGSREGAGAIAPEAGGGSDREKEQVAGREGLGDGGGRGGEACEQRYKRSPFKMQGGCHSAPARQGQPGTAEASDPGTLTRGGRPEEVVAKGGKINVSFQ